MVDVLTAKGSPLEHHALHHSPVASCSKMILEHAVALHMVGEVYHSALAAVAASKCVHVVEVCCMYVLLVAVVPWSHAGASHNLAGDGGHSPDLAGGDMSHIFLAGSRSLTELAAHGNHTLAAAGDVVDNLAGESPNPHGVAVEFRTSDHDSGTDCSHDAVAGLVAGECHSLVAAEGDQVAEQDAAHDPVAAG